MFDTYNMYSYYKKATGWTKPMRVTGPETPVDDSWTSGPIRRFLYAYLPKANSRDSITA